MTKNSHQKNAFRHRFDLKPILDLQANFAERGIFFKLRVLPSDTDIKIHDRFLFTPGHAINMPPFKGAIGEHHHVSEYTHSNLTPQDFERYWEKAVPIEAMLSS